VKAERPRVGAITVPPGDPPVAGVRVESVLPGGIAESIDIRAGDHLLSLNGHAVSDIIDCWFHQSSARLRIRWRRPHGGRSKYFERTVRKAFDEGLGLDLEPFRIHRCRNKCVFCFVHQLPGGLRRELYLKDEDYRLSFLHGNYITCTNLSALEMERIARMKLSPLYVSVHATDPAIRRRLLGRSAEQPIMPVLKWLTRRGIRLHGQIVLCPGINDGTVLEATVSELATLAPGLESLAIVPVGLTAHRTNLQPLEPVSPEYARSFLKRFRHLRSSMSGGHNTPSLLYASDEFYLLAGVSPPTYRSSDNLPQLANGVGMHYRFYQSCGRLLRTQPRSLATGRRVGAITTWMGARVIDRLVRELNLKVGNLDLRVLTTENSLFGPSVTVTGLLPGADFLRAIRANPGFDRYVIPGNALRPWDRRFLDEMTLDGLRKEAGVEVMAGDETCAGFADAVLADMSQDPCESS
jgi:putative radical SAM enzyme (TIGR03279 family)